MSVLLKGMDRIFLCRPTLFYAIWPFFLTGYWEALGGSRILLAIDHPGRFILAVSALTLIMAGAFILNQIRDIVTDRQNGKLFLLADGMISAREAYVEAAFLVLAGLLAGFFTGMRIGVELAVLFIIAGLLYNYPPAQWKDRPVAGLIANGTGGLLTYQLGRMAAGAGVWISPHVIPFTMAWMAVYLNTTLPDREGDAQTGKRTFAVAYGEEAAMLWAFIFEVFVIVSALILRQWLILCVGCLAAPFFAWAAYRKKTHLATRATKASILLLSLAVCLFLPWYLPVMAAVFLTARWYYMKRFNFSYPHLKATS